MGLRATVIKEYKVEYGNTAGFNYGTDLMADIIRDYCTAYYIGANGEPDSGTIWEVDKDEFKAMLEAFRNMTDEEYQDKLNDGWCNTGDDITREEVIRVFEGFLNETPENETWVRFGWN